MPFTIEPMTVDDIPAVTAVEREAFTMPWPSNAYKRELRNPKVTRYIVIRWRDEPPSPASENGHRPPEKRSGLPSFLSLLFPGPNPVRETSDCFIVGYAGLWLMVDEAHITTIAVKTSHRGLGLGEALLQGLAGIAADMGARWLTLEVRVSNTVAQSLYHKYGFHEAGVRRRYYTDNGEDAYIMWSESLEAPEYRARLAELRQELEARLIKAEPRGRELAHGPGGHS